MTGAIRSLCLGLLGAALLVAGLPAAAQQRPLPRHGAPAGSGVEATVPRADDAGPEPAGRGTGAVLRGLDKIAGTTTEMTLAPGEAARLGRLEVRLGECRFPPDDPDSDAFAQLTISDVAAGRIVFSGWMIASSPALSALDDARYDVWVVSCQRVAASGSGPDSSAGSGSAADSRR